MISDKGLAKHSLRSQSPSKSQTRLSSCVLNLLLVRGAAQFQHGFTVYGTLKKGGGGNPW